MMPYAHKTGWTGDVPAKKNGQTNKIHLSIRFGGASGSRTLAPVSRPIAFRVISRLCLLVEIKRIWKYTTEAKMLRYTADFGFRFSLLFEPTGLSEFFPFLP